MTAFSLVLWPRHAQDNEAILSYRRAYIFSFSPRARLMPCRARPIGPRAEAY